MKQQTVIGRLSNQDLRDCITGWVPYNRSLKQKLLDWLEIVTQDNCDLIVSAPANNDPYKKVSA